MAKHAPRGPLKAKTDPIEGPHPIRARVTCTAKSKSTGTRCARSPIAGATVCRVHGGAAPQVKAAALERLKAYQDRAIDHLFELTEGKDFPSVRYQAVRDVLDRTMGKPTETQVVTGADGGPLVVKIEKPW